MTVHIIGICGTFMAGVAQLAREGGHAVRGSDAKTYPPMSDLLERLEIPVVEGYAADNLDPPPDEVVVGNALSRGNPEIEALLELGLPFTSGPQWLGQNILHGRPVVAVAGTHGKTSTSSMLAWILKSAGQDPGFLIGGLAPGLGASATTGSGPFVIEADEYDSAFFDKRSKFVHYFPTTLVLNNLEFDHADIFADLDAIKTQFHHLVRTVRGSGCIIANRQDGHLKDVLDRGCWSEIQWFSTRRDEAAQWQAEAADGAQGFTVLQKGKVAGEVNWSLRGEHNIANGLAAVAAASRHGVTLLQSCAALSQFSGVCRRMEWLGAAGGVDVYDDFAHHPTAIRLTLEAARGSMPKRRLIVVLEPRSNSMRAGAHAAQLPDALAVADHAWVYSPPDVSWDPASVLAPLGSSASVKGDMKAMLDDIRASLRQGDCLIFMSNGGFENAPRRLLSMLEGHGDKGLGQRPEPPGEAS